MSDLPKAKTRPASNWSAIWVLPLIALIIGGWLGWRAYTQQGIEIQVRFESGEGIQVNKTEVVYKGMTVGKVKALALDDEGSNRGVIATIEMNKDVDQYLKTNTRFWLVKPSVSLAGITGLETLVSGNYIAASPGDGEPTRKFKALSEEPPLSDAKPGLHLTIKADRLGSLNRGSPVFYKQIQVGQVKSYLLSEDQSTVEIKVYIEPTYASLVRKHTRFWNASGISIDANLSGVKVRSESLSSIVAGGIAFATPENRKDSPPTDPSLPFRLYEDFDAAAAGIKVKVKLTDFEGLQAGRTPVMYKGIQVGSLKTLKIDPDLSSANAELTLDPLAEDYLVQDTQFWVVKPSISLAGITGLEALVKGNYIAIRPGDKGSAPQREFVARAKAPPLDLRSPGLHMVLFTDNLGSLDVGSPILNKRQVSNLQSFRIVLAPNKEALKHIDQIIHSAGQYEEGETLSVFDLSQSAEQDNKNEEAKEYLARLVAANHNQLGLKDLFELAFEITKVHGQPVIHTDIDGAASNGTTMTIKALTNMYLLLHLMDRDQAGRVRLPYYLDEAADIDEKNQAALLETSLQLGFVPILASVKPQVSAQVAIDLEGGSGPNGIYIDEADWKYIRRHDVVKATVNVQADEPELDEV